MKFGMDAKWLFDGPPSGRRVVHNLVRSLVDLIGDDELHLFLDVRSRGQSPPAGVPLERCHYVWSRNNQLANVFAVPRAADRIGLDAVVYQNFAPPPARTRHARVAFVHDVIFDVHPEFFTWRERLYFKPLRFLTSSADRVCTVSQSERRRLISLDYAKPERVDVVPNAVDKAFVPRECLPAKTVAAVLAQLGIREPFVLYVGRLTARKNVEALVRAMAFVRSSSVQLVVVGAPDRTCGDLVAIANEAGVANRVRLVGAMDMSDERLRVLYAAATVFCFPSLEESFGLPPLEAMASGTPVVVSNVAAINETCGSAAVYIDPADPSEIGAAIDALLVDPERRTTLREAGLERARSFTWDRSAQCLLATVRTATTSYQ
jgi:glycosyltransferase involved in cell wall biosynthesis